MTLNRQLAVGGMVGSALFLPVAFLIGEARDGYSPVSEHISALSEAGASAGWAQSSNFVLFGVLIIGLAVGLHRGINDGEGSVLGPSLIAVVGLFAGVGSAIFSEEPVGAPVTTAGNLHALASIIGFVAVATAMFVLPQRLRQDPRWTALATPSRWMGAIATALFFAFPLAIWGTVEAFESRSGLIQRLFAATVLLWLFLLALRLFRTSKVGVAGRSDSGPS